MDCIQCGATLVDGANYCHVCSAPQISNGHTATFGGQFLGYCAGSGESITTQDKHFKCIECGQLYLLDFRFEDKPACLRCVRQSGKGAVLEQERLSEDQFKAKSLGKAAGRQQTILDNNELLRLYAFSENDWADIPAGRFMMGSPLDEEGRQDNERLHEVEVSAFKLMTIPVTFDMVDRWCQAVSREPIKDEWGWGAMPAINVSYWDAVEFATWLSEQTGWRCRLPTEAEWEYACRAGTTTPFATGQTISTVQANFDGNYPYGSETNGQFRKQTTPVASFPANSLGLYDMHGNVCEWCASQYDERYSSLELLDASHERDNGVWRVLRGGSWDFEGTWVRSANRDNGRPSLLSNIVGFRLARSF